MAEISGTTRLLGLIADPVLQARSPAMANAFLRRRGRDFVLLPMQVGAGELEPVLAGLRRIRTFAGAIVSMPHKTAIVSLLDELTPEARLVGAVNVVRREVDGRLAGSILDGEGFVAGLRTGGHEVRGRDCILAGAGGAAAAIAFALAQHGCASLAIVNRTMAKAESLAARVAAAFPSTRTSAVDGGGRYDLAINATSLGMRADDALPLPIEVIERSRLVAECVISVERTPLLELAAERGRAVHTGMPMLEAQMDLLLRFMGVDD